MIGLIVLGALILIIIVFSLVNGHHWYVNGSITENQYLAMASVLLICCLPLSIACFCGAVSEGNHTLKYQPSKQAIVIDTVIVTKNSVSDTTYVVETFDTPKDCK